MSKKMMKRIVCNAVAVLSAAACLGMATACETAHPEVEMTVTFQGEEYVLEYELYRKVAPSTVNHFLWLAGNGYYDGLCVHNYDSSAKRMYTGAYTVDENEESGLKYKYYYEEIAKFKNYADFPVSVWMDQNKETPLYTVYGEFEENGFVVENGQKKQSYGALTMYYTEKNTTAKAYAPYLGEEKEGEMASRQYKNNSATSQFFISFSQTESSSTKYCTFATLSEDSVEVLGELEQAIEDYISENYGGADAKDEDFISKQSVTVDADDVFVGDSGKIVTYNVPNAPIVIKTVKVTKY